MLERMFGSLFVWQLTRDGRRAWPIVARCIVVALVAFFLAMVVGSVYARAGYSRFEMPEKFAEFEAAFTTPCLYVIFYGCLALTPGLFSPLLARDRESRLLDLLLTTQLTREQVVLGRWGARFVQLLMLFVSTVPILIVSYAYGGARIGMLLGALVVALCAAVSLSAIATLASALARTTREAFAAAYAAPILIAMSPHALHTCVVVLVQANVAPYSWLTSVSFSNRLWEIYVSPVGLFHSTFDADAWTPRSDVLPRIALYAAIHLTATLILWRFAVAAIGRSGEGAGSQWTRIRERVFKRRTCDFRDAPVFVREWRSGASGLWASVQRRIFVLAAVLGLYLPFYCFVFKPFRKLWRLFGDWRDADYAPFYLWTGGALFTFALLQVLQNAGASIANERDRDTWQTLLSTRLTAAEIVRQKVYASLRPAVTLLMLWIPLTLLLAAQGRADLWCVIAPCIVVPSFALFVGASSFVMTLQSRRPWNGLMNAVGICVFVFATLAVVQSALGEVKTAEFVSKRFHDETTGFADGLWLLSSPFLLTPFERQPDPRLIVVTFSAVMLGAAAAIMTFTVEEFPALTGRREKYRSLRGRPFRALTATSRREQVAY